MKKVKIVCTIGPSSQSRTTLEAMMRAGMNVARLNFSHGTYADHKALMNTIRTAAKKTKATVALLQDLQGPRIRVGEVPAEGVTLRKGDKVALVSQSAFGAQHTNRIAIPIQYEPLYKSVGKGNTITIQDGLIVLIVERVDDTHILARVRQGGVVHTHKGMNVPGVALKAPVITTKDKKDIAFGVRQKVDYMALSFVKTAKDIQRLRSLLPKNSAIKIIAKIERAEAVADIDQIIKAADGIMVARGDMGVELGPEKVPLLQKEIVAKCIAAAKPVIVATQMLESMIQNPQPTRAEAADVANAIIDHADAIMLSAESATGNFPVQTVHTMAAIAQDVEPSPFDDMHDDILDHRREARSANRAHAAVELARESGATAVCVVTRNGLLAQEVAQTRSQHLALHAWTHNSTVARQLALVWGVEVHETTTRLSKTSLLQYLRRNTKTLAGIKKGATVVVLIEAANGSSVQTEVVTI